MLSGYTYIIYIGRNCRNFRKSLDFARQVLYNFFVDRIKAGEKNVRKKPQYKNTLHRNAVYLRGRPLRRRGE